MNDFSATILNARLPYLFGNEIEYLHELAEHLTDDDVVVCLGTGPGIMLMALTENNNTNFKLTSIDIGDYHSAVAHLDTVNRIDRARFIVADSALSANRYFDETVSVVLVDADHTKEGVLRDIQAWWKKVRYGGLVFFHDYIKKEPDNGVAEAIAESITDEWEKVTEVGISIVFKKVKKDA